MSIRRCPSCGTDVDVSNGLLGCPVCGGSLAAAAPPSQEAPTSILQFFDDGPDAPAANATEELPRPVAPAPHGAPVQPPPGPPASPGPVTSPAAMAGPGGLVQSLSGPAPGAEPGHRRRLPSGLLLAGAVAVGGLAVLAAFALKGSSHPAPVQAVAGSRASASAPASGPAASPTASGTPAAATDPAATARTIEGLLVRSDQARGTLNAATGPLGTCSVDPSGAASTIQSVVDERKRILADLQGLPAAQVDALPSGGQLVSALGSALQASIAADQAYVQWARDAVGCTPGQAPPSQALRQGDALSRSAQSVKASFVALWNPIAQKYGLATRTANQV